MADVTLSVSEVVPAGVTISAGNQQVLTTSDVYKIPNDGRTVLWLVNANSSQRNVTVATPFVGPSNLALDDLEIGLATQNQAQINGPFDVTYFGSVLSITADGAGVTLMAFRIS